MSIPLLKKTSNLIVCGNNKLSILQVILNPFYFKTIWECEINNNEKFDHELFQSIDECKPIMNNKKILITSS